MHNDRIPFRRSLPTISEGDLSELYRWVHDLSWPNLRIQEQVQILWMAYRLPRIPKLVLEFWYFYLVFRQSYPKIDFLWILLPRLLQNSLDFDCEENDLHQGFTHQTSQTWDQVTRSRLVTMWCVDPRPSPSATFPIDFAFWNSPSKGSSISESLFISCLFWISKKCSWPIKSRLNNQMAIEGYELILKSSLQEGSHSFF